MEKKGLAILNTSQKSYTQIKNVILKNPNYQVELITGANQEILINDALKFKVNTVVTELEGDYQEIDDHLWKEDIKTYVGFDAVAQSCENENLQIVLNGYENLGGLQASLFSLKAKKITLVQRNVILQLGHFLADVARENNSNLIPASNSLYFYWNTLSRTNLVDAYDIQILSSKENISNTILDLICLLKLIPELSKISLSILENKQENRSGIVINTNSGKQVITTQNCNLNNPLYLVSTNEKTNTDLYNTSSLEALTEEDVEDIKSWSTYDSLSLQTNLKINNKEQLLKTIKSSLTDTNQTKLSTLQEVRDCLTASNRTDLDS